LSVGEEGYLQAALAQNFIALDDSLAFRGTVDHRKIKLPKKKERSFSRALEKFYDVMP